MNLILESNKIDDYLNATSIIDYNERSIQLLSEKLKTECSSQMHYIKKAYHYVRDEIAHSADIQALSITLKASEVLKEKHGICFAKSHLLAALLRANKIPTGFCYQRLILDDEKSPYLVLHGLNGVYVDKVNKWIRLDARGNNNGIDAQFSLDQEKLAFPIREVFGEEDIFTVFSNPNNNVVRALTTYKTRMELWDHIPRHL